MLYLLISTRIVKRGYKMNKVYLPFNVKRQNISKLALINFEKNPESVYNALELQYIEDKDEQDNVYISFAFNDALGRPISVTIEEGINKSSTPFNLLAPIGVGSENPEYFPLFWLYDFDFIRKKNLHCEISIDGKDIDPDPFPVPLPIQRQFRNFIRYTFDSRLYTIFEISQTTLKEVELNEHNQYILDDIVYQFTSKGKISYIKSDTTYIRFKPSLNLMKAQEGIINISTDNGMGFIKGEFSMEQIDSSNVRFKCNFNKGWKANVHLFTHKIVVNDKSIFATWPKQYYYTLDINLDSKKVNGKWENHL